MKKMEREPLFVNFTNHPSCKWSSEQKLAAEKYGRIIDVPFPQVGPELTEKEIAELADEYVNRIMSLHPSVVLCQGEFTVCFKIVAVLKQKDIPVFAACSRRIVEEAGDTKIARFVFEKFRNY